MVQWVVQWVAQLAVQWDASVDPVEPYGASGFGVGSIPNHAQFLIFATKHHSKQYVMLYHKQSGLVQVGKERHPKFTQNLQSGRSVYTVNHLQNSYVPGLSHPCPRSQCTNSQSQAARWCIACGQLTHTHCKGNLAAPSLILKV